MVNYIKNYESIPLQNIEIEDVSIGLRQTGEGNDLVLIHGFPTHGYTWRKLLPKLAKRYKCHILDLPGLGDSTWTNKTDFKSEAQARYIIELLSKLDINRCSIIAHNSGATIARAIAIKKPALVKNLVLLNTEIPHHRPPWIPFYQKIGLLPLIPFIVRILFRQNWFIKSPMGFKEFYSNKSMLNEDINIGPYLNPLLNSGEKTAGAFKYLKGIDWILIDELAQLHREIKANVLFLWGEEDKTFPIELGREMAKQFINIAEFVVIKNASLLPHEEKPIEVTNAIVKFLDKEKNT